MRLKVVGIFVGFVESGIVINLTVTHEPDVTLVVLEGLISRMSRVHDGEPVKGKTNRSLGLHNLSVIGASVHEVLEGLFKLRHRLYVTQTSKQPTHVNTF